VEPPRPIRYLIWQSSLLLRLASLLVPRPKREAWYSKRNTETWHWIHFLHESGRLNATTKLELAKNLWEAFRDAAWQRWDREKVMRIMREVPPTPRFCLYTIGLLFLAILIATRFAPTIRLAFSPLPFKNPDRLAALSLHGEFIHYHTDNLFKTAQQWAQQSKTAEAVATYSWDSSGIHSYRGPLPIVSARVSPNFFEVLGNGAALGRLFRTGDEQTCVNCIVISHDLWVSGFNSDPRIIGKEVGLYVYKWGSPVIGVLPANFKFISPDISVFTLTQPASEKFNFASRSGAVMRLRPGASLADATREFEKFSKDAGSTFGFATGEVTSLKATMGQGMQIYLLFTVLVLVGSMGMLALRFAKTGPAKVHLGTRERWRWWGFFILKTGLLLAACFVASLEGTRRFSLMFNGFVHPITGPASTWFFVVSTVVAVSWSLRDQYRRCRICLKRLSHEAYVGAPSYLLLDWWGTELACSQGHGLLHVAPMQASWMDGDEWIQLDESWKPLFKSEQINLP
jgi:MacB-like protein